MKKVLLPSIAAALILAAACGDKPAGAPETPVAGDDATADGGPLSLEETVGAWIAAATGDTDTLKSALDRGLDVNGQDPNHGGTILITAALAGQTESVKLILEKNPDLEIKDNEQNTALQIAAFFCHPEILQELIDAGAEINPKDKQGATPLDAATTPWTEEFAGIYKLVGGILQMDIDLERIKNTRPKIAEILKKAGGKKSEDL